VQGTDGGKGSITISTSMGSENLSILVTDTGIGIQSEELEQIFEPLFSTKSFGVGLGMPIVKNIVEEHGGTVKVTSEPGTGTTVTVILPT
jgi:signal transduction histidine kinase